jgi:hypothetical protein
MRIEPREPPREFAVGRRGARLAHVADVWLGDDELITLRTESGTELDVTRKDWGYYATPSLNRRLAEHGLRAALCVGVPRAERDADRMYVMVVEAGRERAFAAYLEAEEMRVLAWLDSDERVGAVARTLEEGLR